MKTINGVTLKDITRLMNKTEKLINWYNKKYNFQMENASAKEVKEYEGAIQRWDFLKAKRDLLNNN
jgi:hypothetical protein